MYLSRMHSIEDDLGAALVLTALFLVVLLGFSALVIDVGLLYINRLALVNAVDAAALAGVQDLPYSPTMAMEKAKEYAAANGANGDEVKVVVRNGDHEVQVTASRDVKLYLARVFGITEQRLTASAAAQVGSISGCFGVAPFGVVEQDFILGEQYILKCGPHRPPGYLRGNFGALALGDQGASNYENNIKYGYNEKLEVGDWVDTEPGNMSGPTVRGVRHRIEQCQHEPKCTYDSVKNDCSRLVIVPVIRNLDKAHGRDSVQVVGFAAFFLEGTLREGDGGDSKHDDDKGESSVLGRFIRRVLPGEVGNVPDFGLKGYKLVE